jgi:hypothetical protein
MGPCIGRTAVAQVQSLRRGFLQAGGFPFNTVMTVHDLVDRLRQTCAETCDRLVTPLVTLGSFVPPIPRDAPSCRAAVARLQATRVAQGLAPCAPRPGGYGTARQRLAASRRHGLLPQRGQRLPQGLPPAWLWHGRAVKSVEGSGGSRPDTEAQQPA